MKYLSVVNYCFVDHPGGAPRVAWDMCMIMRNRGHDVTMFCQKERSEHEEVCEYDGIKVVRFEFPKTFCLDPLKLNKQINAAQKIAQKHLSAVNWDVVHIHIPIEGEAVYRVIGQVPKYIYTMHSPVSMELEFVWSMQGLAGKTKLFFGKRLINSLEHNLLKRMDRIQTLSLFTKKCLQKIHGIHKNVVTIPHWVRGDLIRQCSKHEAREFLDWPKDANIIFTVRGMRERYGLDVAINAIAPLLKQYDNLHFVLAGSGPLKESLINLAKQPGTSDKIQFMGRVSDETLRKCYEAADLFIIPTRAMECFGLIVLEAFAYGLPIISTDAGALPELIKPISSEMIVPAGNVEALREKIKSVIDGSIQKPDPQVIIDHIKNNYTYNVIVPKIIKMIENW